MKEDERHVGVVRECSDTGYNYLESEMEILRLLFGFMCLQRTQSSTQLHMIVLFVDIARGSDHDTLSLAARHRASAPSKTWRMLFNATQHNPSQNLSASTYLPSRRY